MAYQWKARDKTTPGANYWTDVAVALLLNEQYVADAAAVEAVKAGVRTTVTVLGVTGTLDLSLYTLTATLIAAIDAAKADILTTRTLYTVTGTFDATNLSVGNVIQDVAFGVGLTGTGANLLATHTTYLSLEAGRNSATAGEGQILSTYSVTIAGSTTNGTYVPIAQANARRIGAGYYGAGGAVDGLCAVPGNTDVRYGVPVDDALGLCYVPAAADVEYGVAVEDTVGALIVPLTTTVKDGTIYGAAEEFTGTYSPGGTYLEGQAAHQAADLAFLNLNVDEMIVANTTIQAQYGCNAGTAVVEEHTANQVLKSAGGNYNDDNLSVGNVRPVAFGLSQTGTLANLVATDAAYVALEATRNSKTAGAGQILTGYSVTIAGSATNGTFDESTRNTDPGVANVKDGVTYKILNVSLEGTYESGAGGTYPAAAYVHSDAGAYGPTGVEYTPSLSALANWCLVAGITWPALDEVDGDVAFGPVTGLEYVGTGVNATTIPQIIRDAMKLAPTAGDPAAGSVDKHLDDIVADVAGLDGAAMRGTDGAYTGTPPTADAIGTDAAGKVLVTPSQKIVTNASGQVSASNALTGAEMFAAVLTSQMTEAYAADGVAPTLAQAIFLIQQSLHEFAISGTTRTVKKLDGVETAATFTLDSATAPTSTTRAS